MVIAGVGFYTGGGGDVSVTYNVITGEALNVSTAADPVVATIEDETLTAVVDGSAIVLTIPGG